MRFRDATPADVPRIAALLNAAAGALAAQHGHGPWANLTHEAAVARSLTLGRVRVGLLDRALVTTLCLQRKKPWAIDVAYFTPVQNPRYVTNVAVAVSRQRQGWGRLAFQDAAKVAREDAADVLRLDAYDAAAGASGFYQACGFVDRGRRIYRNTPLRYWERLLTTEARAVQPGTSP